MAAAPAQAAPGDADPTFGVLGEALLEPPTKDTLELTGLVELPNRQLIASARLVGRDRQRGGVLRFSANGTLDRRFGGDGLVELDVLRLAAVPLLDPQGRVLVWGPRAAAGAGSAVVRLLSDGRVDTSYGQNGLAAIIGNSARFEGASAFGQPDGGVVVAGADVIGSERPRPAVARLMPNGSLDPAFGNAGIARLGIEERRGTFTVGAHQPGGGIVVAGEMSALDGFGNPQGTNVRWTAARFGTDGRLDPSFGRDGLAEDFFEGPRIGGLSELIALADGRLILGGAAPYPDGRGTDGLAVARANQDGSPDPTFEEDGRVVHRTPGVGAVTMRGAQLALQADGKLVAAGSHVLENPSQNSDAGWVLGRLDAEGLLDPGFGRDGWTIPITGTFWMRPKDLLRTADGKLVLAADAAACNRQAPVLMRFHAGEPGEAKPDSGPLMRTCNTTSKPDADGAYPIAVQCPFVEAECTVFMELEILESELRKAGSRPPAIHVGHKRFRLAGGGWTTALVKPRSSAKRIIAKLGTVRARAVFSAIDRSGRVRTGKRPLLLRAPKRR